MEKIALPFPVVNVIPHEAPMSLLRNVIAHDDDTTRCDICIASHSLFLTENYVNAWVGLEYMAQAVAAHAGMKARANGESMGTGYLLGTRQADFLTEKYVIGQTLHVSARHVWGEGELFSFDCCINDASDGRLLATAQLNVFRPLGEK